jgi:peroxiredoxin
MSLKLSSLTALVFYGLTAFAAAPKSGEMAPDFSLKGADGKTYKLSEFKGKTVVLEWFNQDCPYVRKFYDSKTMQNLQAENTAKGVVWLTVVSSASGKEGFLTAATASKLRSEKGMSNTTMLLDDKGAVGKLYSAKTTPHMFVIDKTGKLAYQGAIDDQPSANPETLKKAKNYVASALSALEKGEPVKDISTTPYGCSVKY